MDNMHTCMNSWWCIIDKLKCPVTTKKWRPVIRQHQSIFVNKNINIRMLIHVVENLLGNMSNIL
jgi:hypothetical protein